MSTAEVANALMAMWNEGRFLEAGEHYWADDVVSVEAGAPPGGDPVSRGKAAAQGKGQWWANAHEVHSTTVAGPWFNGDQFAVRFTMDVTLKESGQRFTMDEAAVYTIRESKIAEERFFYGG